MTEARSNRSHARVEIEAAQRELATIKAERDKLESELASAQKGRYLAVCTHIVRIIGK